VDERRYKATIRPSPSRTAAQAAQAALQTDGWPSLRAALGGPVAARRGDPTCAERRVFEARADATTDKTWPLSQSELA
jgi:hypothetical protein